MGFLGMVKHIAALFSSGRAFLVYGPVVSLLLYGGYRYIHYQGYERGHAEATQDCESEKALQKDTVIESLVESQKEILRVVNETLEVNRSIDEEVRRKDDTRTNTIKEIIKEQPILVTPDCSPDYSLVELFDTLAAVGSSSHSDNGDPASEDTSE